VSFKSTSSELSRVSKETSSLGSRDVKTQVEDDDEGGVTVCGGKNTWVSRGSSEKIRGR
jgi:hypothetical protein